MSDLISRADAIEAVCKLCLDGQTAKVDGYFIPIRDALENVLSALPSADAVKIAYICDGRKCDNDCSECFRTLDIEHARDFKLMGNTYYQQELADAIQFDFSKFNKKKLVHMETYHGLYEKYMDLKHNAVKVVRCKHCRWWQDNNGGYPHANCRWCETETPDADDYCSGGERAEQTDKGIIKSQNDVIESADDVIKQHGRLIDADALVEYFESVRETAKTVDAKVVWKIPVGQIIAMIEDEDVAPTVEVPLPRYVTLGEDSTIEPLRPHGEWQSDKDMKLMRCSECGTFFNKYTEFFDFETFAKYCPYCGASMDMRGDDND